MATLDQLSFEDVEKLLDITKNTPIFKTISLTERQELLENAAIVTSLRGEYVFHSEEKPLFFFILYSGRLLEFKESHNKKKIIRIIKPGNLFGIEGAVEGEKYKNNVKALEDSRVVSFPREELLKILKNHPELKSRLS